MIWLFGLEVCEVLAAWPGIKAALPAGEGEVLTTGPPEMSHPILIEVPFLIYQD